MINELYSVSGIDKFSTSCYRYLSTVLSILSNVLTEGPQSLFYQELIGAELGADFAPGTGLSAYSKVQKHSYIPGCLLLVFCQICCRLDIRSIE